VQLQKEKGGFLPLLKHCKGQQTGEEVKVRVNFISAVWHNAVCLYQLQDCPPLVISKTQVVATRYQIDNSFSF
jgi:hypothetical protein